MKKQIYTFSILLTCLFVLVQNVTAQNPLLNSGLETWTTMSSYKNPDYWGTTNDIFALNSLVPNISQSTDAHAGSFSAKLSAANIPTEGIVGGGMSTGYFDMVTEEIKPQIPINAYYDSLVFWIKTNLIGGDTMICLATLSKWNASTQSRDIIGFKGYSTATNTNGWERVSIYMDTLLAQGKGTLVPDSVSIIFSSAIDQATLGSYILLDDIELKKAGNPSSILSKSLSHSINIYPNPCKDFLILDMSSLPQDSKINIFNCLGQIVQSLPCLNAHQVMYFDKKISAGQYFMKISTNEKVFYQTMLFKE
jgi:hypothetical protein